MLSSSRSTTACIVLSLLACLWGAQAQAHARLISAQPAPNTTVNAVKIIRLQFSEALAKGFSSFELARSDGGHVTLRSVASKDGKVLTAALATTLSPGAYTVSWTAVSSDDGHKTSGHYEFNLR